MVDNCRSKRLRTKLLAEQDLTLDRTLALSAATEAAEHQAAQIAHDGERVSAVATRVRENTRPRSSRQRAQGGNRSQAPQDNKPTCNRCGTRGHTGDVCQRTKGKKCFKCGQQGHFSSVCKQSTTHEEPPNPGVRYVSEPSSGSDDDYMNEYAYATSLSKSVTVTVGDVPISMLIDSGSTWNTLNSECKERLVQQGIAFVPCKRRIHPYNSPPIPVHQLVKTKISLDNGEELQAEFLIVEGTATPLLGKGTAESLGILQVGVNHVIGGNCYTDELVKRFPRLWTGIGCLKGVQVKLHIDHSVPPVAQKHNRVPFHKQAKVAKEIAKLGADDIIERVSGPTEWVSRIVTPPKPKKPDEIRLCVDMRAANKASLRTRHVTPTVDELITNFSGATVFSKLDLRSGYHQLVLHPSSRYITTFSTHLGLYRYKRLSFGINAAAEVFQHEIQSVIDGVAGAVNISDDIAVFGVDQATHDRALEETLTRLHDTGLTVNVVKCEFRRSGIEFFGLVFSKDGISPDPKKVADLHAATEPKNPSEVRSFLGMAQFSARFIRDYATITEPLRALTRQNTEWRWGKNELESFNAVKESLSESATNAYFDTTQPVELVVDASPVGLAALLVQRGRVVTYASRALSNVETRYSQTEREALAVVWACEHFDRFLNGAPQFTVFTDHKPLETIWQKPRPPLRIERWGLRLQPYKMVVKYRPGTDNPADYLSRHPAGQNILRSHEQQMAEHYVNTIASAAVPLAMTVEEIQRETTKDPTLQAVIELVRSKKWHNIAQYQGTDVNCATLRQFSRVQDELTVNESGNMVLRNYQIVIPQSLQQRAIDIAHEGHQGICKTKALLRSKVWFPGSDAAAEEAVRRCIPCQANTTRRQAEPLAMTPLPRGPWLNVSIDFCGPLPSGEYLLVIFDGRVFEVSCARNHTEHCRRYSDTRGGQSVQSIWLPGSHQIWQRPPVPGACMESVPQGMWSPPPSHNPALATG